MPAQPLLQFGAATLNPTPDRRVICRQTMLGEQLLDIAQRQRVPQIPVTSTGPSDSTGATIDFLLSALRDAAAAERLFRKALSDPSHPQPRVIDTDKARLYDSAIAAVKAEGTLHRRCRHRPVQYLNNILEQDRRAIQRRVKAKQSFREFQAARRTIEGYEAM